MNQVADKNAINGKGQPEQLLPAGVAGQEGSQAPSPEAKKPFVPDKRKTVGRDYWKAILVGAVIVASILAVSLIPKSRPKTNSGQAAHDQQKAESGYGSTTPINNVASNSDRETDGSKIGPGVVANTAKPRPTITTATNLGEVPAFGNPATWQPAPYQGPATTDTPAPAEDKNEHDALDKPSLVFVRNSSATTAQAKPQQEINLIDLGLGLPPGTRLRAHLESALNTAVKTPVVAVIEYNYEKNGETLIPAGAKVVGQLESADRSGYIGVHFNTLLLPDGTSINIDATATDLQLGPLRGRVQGKNRGKNIFVHSLAGVGEAMATLVGRSSLNQPLNEADLMRGRVVTNIGQASDQEVERLAITERIVVSMPASTQIYVVLEKQTKQLAKSGTPDRQPVSSSTTTEQLLQLLQLQRELNQSVTAASTSQ
jgi:hypothetical protein